MMFIIPERGVCQDGENPIRALIYLLLMDEQRKFQIEKTPVKVGRKEYPPAPERIIDKIVQAIGIKPLGEAGYEYRYHSLQLGCNIRVIASTRLYEDLTFNPYKEADKMLS